MDFQENITTTPNRSQGDAKCCKGGGMKKIRTLRHPYRNTVELNSTVLVPGSIIEKMPLYTPPKPTQHVKNPFEQAWLLKEKMGQPVCSPSLFQKAISPINKSPAFTWSVDEISVLRPAVIDENPSQEFTSWYSPDTESQAQAAIDRFFSSMSQNTLESPAVSRKTQSPCSVACQTNLSFPPFLPDGVEAELEALSQRLTAGLDESMNTLNSSSCSARRKILSVEVEPPSDDDLASLSDKDESMLPMYAATPVKTLPHSSPGCSPIPTECLTPAHPETSVCAMEESFRSQSPSR